MKARPAENGDDPLRAVSVRTAAEMLEVSEKTIRRLVEQGIFKPIRVLRALRIPVIQIREFIEKPYDRTEPQTRQQKT